MANEHYSEFIEETFIAPIRSVLIVDDDYPTFDEILKNQEKRNAGRDVESSKSWYTDPKRIKGVINSFRTSDRPLLVDIHDGTNVTVGREVTVAAHLHQSDLLVLDYELDRSRSNDGTRAIKIVRSLMSNNHFNMVVVHTNANLDDVFEEFRLGLLSPSMNTLTREEKEKAGELIEAEEDESEGFGARLFESVGTAQYLHSRRYPQSRIFSIMFRKQEPYVAFCDECDSVPGWTNHDRKLVLRYALSRAEGDIRKKLNLNSSTKLSWSTEAVKWIRSDSLFMAFSDKNDDDDLLAELQTALNDWNPQPSRLFLAKLRAEMDEYGVVAQDQALGNRHALAHWYNRLLHADGSERRWHIADSVSRHSEQLMSSILPRVEDFATRLVTAEVANGDLKNLSKDHFKVDLAKDLDKQQAQREHNAFVCSMRPVGWHLTAGQVFLMDGDYWVCVSPACDMVGAHYSEARKEMFGKRLRFTAVKLQSSSNKNTLESIQSNRFVFLQLDEGIKGFCFNDLGAENSAPDWHTLYAKKLGEFNKGTFDFTVQRTEKGGNGRLVAKTYQAKVISQLRYEYALNLIQRLGVSLTRVGLDFTS